MPKVTGKPTHSKARKIFRKAKPPPPPPSQQRSPVARATAATSTVSAALKTVAASRLQQRKRFKKKIPPGRKGRQRKVFVRARPKRSINESAVNQKIIRES